MEEGVKVNLTKSCKSFGIVESIHLRELILFCWLIALSHWANAQSISSPPTPPSSARSLRPENSPEDFAGQQGIVKLPIVVVPSKLSRSEPLRPVDPINTWPRASTETATRSLPGFLAAPFYDAINDSDGLPGSVAIAADFDQRNGPDIATFQIDGTLTILLNDGKGNLVKQSSNTSATDPSTSIQYAEASDLNGDGYPDIVAADYEHSVVLVYLNNQDGTFAPAYALPIDPSSRTRLTNGGAITVADVNGDGLPDIVAVSCNQVPNPNAVYLGDATSTLSIQVFINTGQGSFLLPTTHTDTTLQGTFLIPAGQGVRAGDLNGDGVADLAIELWNYATKEPNIATSLGTGQGFFSSFVQGSSILANCCAASDLELVDLNRDGRLDAAVLVSAPGGSLYTALGDGSGGFGQPANAFAGIEEPWAQLFRLGDFNGDGIPDAILFNFGDVSIYQGNGDGTFNPVPVSAYVGSLGEHEFVAYGSAFSQPVPQDFDGDGNLDFASFDVSSGTVSVYRNDGRGGFFAAPVITASNTSTLSLKGAVPADQIVVLAAGDINGDGFPDLLAYNYASFYYDPQGGGWPDLIAGINDGQGHFTFSTILSGHDQFGLFARPLPLLADYNHDGRADVLLQASQSVYTLLSRPDSTFSAPIRSALSLPTSCLFSSLEAGDLNNDGNLDVLATYTGYGDDTCSGGSTPGGFFSLLGDGNGAFRSLFTPYNSPNQVALGGGGTPYQGKLVDLNGDGKLDLVVDDDYQPPWGHLVCLWCATPIVAIPGNGDGTFNSSQQTELLTSNRITGILSGDLNHDGKQDLVLMTGGQFSGNGGPPIVATSSRSPRPDNVPPDPNSDGALVLLGHGDFTFDAPVLLAPGSYPTSGALADLNGDGNLDLILNSGDHRVSTALPRLISLPGNADGTFGSSVATVKFSDEDELLVGNFNGTGAPGVIVTNNHFRALTNQGSELFSNLSGCRLTLSVSNTSIPEGSPVTLHISISTLPESSLPTGAISLSSAGSVVATVNLAQGVEQDINVDDLPDGSNVIVASYGGDTSHMPVKSAPVTIQVVPAAPSFTISAAQSAVTVTNGTAGLVQLNLTANSTFTGSIQFACGGLPTGSSCAFSPSSLSLAGNGTGSVHLSISNGTTGAHLERVRTGLRLLPVVPAVAAFLLIPPLIGYRNRRSISASVMLIFGVTALSAALGCGGSHATSVSGKTRDVPVTITATGQSGGVSIQQTVVVVAQMSE